MTLLLATLLTLYAAEKPDTHLCAYWYAKLDDITRWETMLIEDVPRIAEEENQYAAMDFEMDLRQRIRAIQKRIEEENRE